LYLKEQKYGMAQRECKQVVARIPDHFEANRLLGNTYLAQNQLDAADAAFTKLVTKFPENPVGYFHRGIVKRARQDLDGAVADFEAALEKEPLFMEAFTHLTLTHVAKKDIQAGLKRCDRQLTLVKDSAQFLAMVYEIKGRLYKLNNEMKQAEHMFQAAIEADADYLQPYRQLAKIYAAGNALDDAQAQYEKVLAKAPDDVASHMMLGTICQIKKDNTGSEKHYRTALELKPKFAPAANNLAYLLSQKADRYDEAYAFASIAKERLPDDPMVMDTLGWIYYKKGLFDLAAIELTESADKLKDNAIVQYHLGMTYYQKGQNDLAKEQLRKALALDHAFEGAEEAGRIIKKLENV
jgi:tetratricopeptide (TPR) repeat protein